MSDRCAELINNLEKLTRLGDEIDGPGDVRCVSDRKNSVIRLGCQAVDHPLPPPAVVILQPWSIALLDTHVEHAFSR